MMQRRPSLALLILSFFAFVSLGLPDAVLGIAWPSIWRTFEIEIGQLGWLITTGMIGYVSSSFLSGWLTSKMGVGRLLLASSLAIVAAQVGFAAAPTWPAMVAIGVVAGLGAGAIDAAINAFAAHRFSPRVVNWIHACYGIGATCGPMLMTLVLARQLSWRAGYAILAGLIGLMCIGFALTLRLWDEAPQQPQSEAEREAAPAARRSLFSALARPIVLAQVALFFLYTGLEAAVGQWGFSILTESRNLEMRTAGLAIGGYWACLTLGRILFGFLAHRIAAATLLRAALIASPICLALVWMRLNPLVTMLAICALGLWIAPIFPLLISLTPSRVGSDLASHSIGFQVGAASLGAAAISGVAGVLAQKMSLEAIPPYLVGVSVAVWLIYEISTAAIRTSPPARVSPQIETPTPAA